MTDLLVAQRHLAGVLSKRAVNSLKKRRMSHRRHGVCMIENDDILGVEVPQECMGE